MTMKIETATATAAVLFLCASSVSANNLVTNGTFVSTAPQSPYINSTYTPDPYYNNQIAGWSTTGYNFVFFPDSTNTPSGSQADAVQGGVGGSGGADQGFGFGFPLRIWGPGDSWTGNTDPTDCNQGCVTPIIADNGFRQLPDGSNFLAMNGDWNTAAVTQTVNGLVVGQTYVLTFQYAFAQQYNWFGETHQTLTASLGESSWTTSYTLPSTAFSGWQAATVSFVATSSSEILSFLAGASEQFPPMALVGDVALTGPSGEAVPEPASWATIILGLATVGGVARRRRRAAD